LERRALAWRLEGIKNVPLAKPRHGRTQLKIWAMQGKSKCQNICSFKGLFLKPYFY